MRWLPKVQRIQREWPTEDQAWTVEEERDTLGPQSYREALASSPILRGRGDPEANAPVWPIGYFFGETDRCGLEAPGPSFLFEVSNFGLLLSDGSASLQLG